MDSAGEYHKPVLLHECIDNMNIFPEGIYLDATFGGGGHSSEILKRLGKKGKLIVFDQDADALKNFTPDNRVLFIRENFKYATRFLRLYKIGKINGVLADLGVSSYQFDTAERGFSNRFDASLDMRMDSRNPITAAHILNTYPLEALIKLFEQYGEITNAKKVCAYLVKVRSQQKIETIAQWKDLLQPFIYGKPQKYLAQVFQALRIEVNDELNALKIFLETISNDLDTKGRLCIITFHSLEDKLVKNWMKNESFEEQQNPIENKKIKQLKLITKKPILPSEEELRVNNRARSAKLRVAEKI